MIDSFHRKVAGEFFAYLIKKPHRGGHGIHSPFLFSFVNEVVYAPQTNNEAINSIIKLTKQLSKDQQILEIEDLGAGSRTMPFKTRKVADIARRSSSSPKFGKWLQRCVAHLQPQTIIELGTCLGIGSAYLAIGNPQAAVYTIEGSESLRQVALQNFNKLGIKNITTYQGNFNATLPVLLKQCGTFDLAYVDGNHQKDATLQYFEQLTHYANERSVIIFDDIRWSEGMAKAWLEICRNRQVTLSLDFFRFGIVFFNPKLQKEHFTIYY
jgi:predicted O-methyltransferase YrrM